MTHPESAEAALEAHLVVCQGLKVPIHIGGGCQAIKHGCEANIVINESRLLHGMHLGHRSEEEVPRVEGPPGPPHQGDRAVIVIGVADVFGVTLAGDSEKRFAVGFLCALKRRHECKSAGCAKPVVQRVVLNSLCTSSAGYGCGAQA